MALKPPTYIEAAGVIGSPIAHAWDSTIADDVLADQPALTARLSRMSYRAALAFTLGCVEWVIWRFEKELDERSPFDVVEAAWAGLSDWRYLKSLEVPSYEDDLPIEVGGPLTHAFWILKESFLAARDIKPFWQFAASSSELALRVVNNPGTHKAWRRLVVDRLTTCFRREDSDRLGPPVPRTFLEPDATCSDAELRERLQSFLRQLSPSSNPYLRSADELRSMGCDAIPYSL